LLKIFSRITEPGDFGFSIADFGLPSGTQSEIPNPKSKLGMPGAGDFAGGRGVKGNTTV